MKKDDLIAEVSNLGLGKDLDLVSMTKEQLIKLINKKDVKEKQAVQEPRVIPKHKFYRG